MTDMTIAQAGALVAELYKAATGVAVPAPVNLSNYISVATTALRTGTDVLYNALSQMWTRTIFAVREYTGDMFRDLEYSESAWGNATRKVSFLSRLPETNDAYTYPVAHDQQEDPPTGDGQSVDMYTISKDKPVQTAFYGESTYAAHRTRFLQQLETALMNPEEFVAFNAAALQSMNNERRLWRENFRRGIIINAIGALDRMNRKIHLLTEYNAINDTEYDVVDVMKPEVFTGFMRWVHGRLAELRDRFREANTLYTTQLQAYPNGYGVLRHTPDDRLRIKIGSKYLHMMRSVVLSSTYNPDYLSLDGVEGVPYWQKPGSPDQISGVTVCYTANTGLETTVANVSVSAIFGIMYDTDMMGYARIRDTMYSTPLNARGQYYNDWYSEVYKTRFDVTEKGLLLLLD